MMGWMAALQVVRKRLNRPMNFAEKVRVTCASRATRRLAIRSKLRRLPVCWQLPAAV